MATRVRRGPADPSAASCAGVSHRDGGQPPARVRARRLVPRLAAPRAARCRGPAPHRRDGPGDRGLRPQRSARVHDLQGAADRRAADAGVAEPEERPSSPSKISASTSTTASISIRIGSAMLANIRRGRLAQGGSTITQQLARQSFLTPDKTYRRKLQELILAARIERLYSKDQILEMYLNKVYFGDGLYGVEAAARGYFGKHASELSVPEAALLAGLVKSPSVVRADGEPGARGRAAERRAPGDGGRRRHRSDDVADRARATKPVLNDSLRAEEPHGQYFKEQVRRELVDRFGWQRVYQGGLRVYSTIDMPMQIAADAAVAAALKSLDERRAAVAKRRKQAPADRRRRTAAGRARRARARTRATCARWSAAATSTTATSTAPSRRSGSRARRSSRSSTRRRWRPATRRRRSSRTSTRRLPRCRATGRRKTSTPRPTR